ncbi:MAG: hypothetical protein EPN82_11070 [Bacteroidetes bacterium]|nr:MAG: hypothetical protein EPN82_11070 [Bacteroidota bacterium]
MVTTLQGAVQVTSPVSNKLTENVTVKQPVISENSVQSQETQQTKNNKTDLNKVDFSNLQNKLKEILNEDNLYIKFDKDKDTDKMILKIIDNETKEVVQQIPPEISLKIARYIAVMYDNVNITNFQA